jgi:hypothetical protein
MALKSDIQNLGDSTIMALAAAHDHLVYTKKIWRIFDVEVRRRGRKIVLDNKITHSRMTEQELLPVAQASVSDYLPKAAIQQFASLSETFLTDLIRLWLTEYPQHLKGQVDVQTIVAAPDKASILRGLVEQYVLAMSYKRASEWFKQLHTIVAINYPTAREIDQYAEFKATRDVFVHNRGIATEAYLDKAGALARTTGGLSLELTDSYLHEAWRLCRKIATDVGNAAATKA